MWVLSTLDDLATADRYAERAALVFADPSCERNGGILHRAPGGHRVS